MADNIRHNPWKGLNFYVEGEILYGRNVEILSLSQYIFNNTQTVLYGRSGIGKSSILNAGIFPKARQHGMTPVSIRLKHGDSNDYLDQIKEALSFGGLIAKELIPAINGKDDESLWEFMHRHEFFDEADLKTIPLLVFDQFEEIFTLQTNEQIKRDFFKQLGNLLNDVKPSYVVSHESQTRQQHSIPQETKVVSSGAFKGLNLKLNVRKDAAGYENNVRYIERPDYHIVFALREDFLSSLELYAASIPVMKDNRFGLLPLNEEQAADIIRLPQPGLVSDEVTKLIIEQVTGRTDFILDGIPEIEVDAAVLSLFLSRLYLKKTDEDSCITADLVNTSSGHIIHDFYVESVLSDPSKNEILSPESILILEDQLLTSEGRRNNVSRSDLIALGVSDEELRILTNKRKLLRQFHHGNDIRIEYIHDILCPVVKERKEQRELLKQQQLEYQRQEREKQQIIEEAEAHARRIKQRNKRIFIWLSSIAMVLVAIGLYYWYAKIYLPNKVYEKYYAEFELVNGWPVGINELSDHQRAKMPLYYKLSHIGNNTHDTDVEVMSSNSMLPISERITNWPEKCDNPGDKAGKSFNDLLCKVKKIHFTGTETNDKVSRMELKDEKDELLMLMSYFHLNDREAWMNYTNTYGQSMPIRDNGIDRVKMSWDSVGRIEYQRYYNSSGVAKPINSDKKIAGFYRKYSKTNQNEVEYYTLNIYGLPNTDIPYNLRKVTTNGDTLITSYFSVKNLEDSEPKEAVGVHGYSRVVNVGNREFLYIPNIKKPVALSVTDYDNYGNPTKQTISGTVNDSLPPVVKWRYEGNTGLPTQKMYLFNDERPFGKNKDDIYRWETKYDSDGNIIAERKYNIKDSLVYSHITNTVEKNGITIVTDILNDTRKDIYITKIDTISADRMSTAYYGKNGLKINQKVPFWAEDSVSCHHLVIETKGNTKTFKHYAVDGSGHVSPVDTEINPSTARTTSFIIRKTYDNNGNITNIEISDADDNIKTRMMYFIQNGQTIGRAVWGIDDTAVRCPEWEEEGLGYYKIFYSKDFDNSYVYLQPFDEWMNHSVFLLGESYEEVSSRDLKNRKITSSDGLFEGNVTISHPLSISLFSPSKSISDLTVPYLHILSKNSPLYSAGFKDGDRIAGIGNWHLGESQEKFAKEWDILQNNPNNFELKVLRPTPKGYTHFNKSLTCNSSNSIYAEYHFMNFSNAEKKYYECTK